MYTPTKTNTDDYNYIMLQHFLTVLYRLCYIICKPCAYQHSPKGTSPSSSTDRAGRFVCFNEFDGYTGGNITTGRDSLAG